MNTAQIYSSGVELNDIKLFQTVALEVYYILAHSWHFYLSPNGEAVVREWEELKLSLPDESGSTAVYIFFK